MACTVLRDSDSFLDGLMSIEVRVFSVGLVGVLLSVTAIVVGISVSTTVTSVTPDFHCYFQVILLSFLW